MSENTMDAICKAESEADEYVKKAGEEALQIQKQAKKEAERIRADARRQMEEERRERLQKAKERGSVILADFEKEADEACKTIEEAAETVRDDAIGKVLAFLKL